MKTLCLVALTAAFAAALQARPARVAAPIAAQNDRGDLPEGEGRDTVVRRCVTSCHPATALTRARHTRDQWRSFIGLMRYKGKGVTLTDEDFKTVLTYLHRHFGSANVNGEPAEDLEAALDIPAGTAAAIVKYRDDHGEFRSLEDLAGVPGLTREAVESRKNRIVFKPW